MFDIAGGSRILITGGAAGFGLGVARVLLDTTDACVVLADINDQRLREAVGQLGAPGRVSAVQVDVRDGQSVKGAVEVAVKAMGGLDGLVNSAGMCRITPYLEISEEEWDLVVDTNLKGTFLMTQHAMPYLIDSGRGRVVNLSSTAGARGASMLAHYVSSKFGVVGLTQSLALEFGPSGVRVNAVLPGSTPDTEMGRQLMDRKIQMGLGASSDEVSASAAQGSPSRRVGRQEDTVNAVLYLLSEESSWVYGHSLAVDGGAHLGAGNANPNWK